MDGYGAALALHFLAATLWLGHMFFWSIFAGPALKGVVPAETATLLRERSLFLGGLGWPALAVLVGSGLFMLEGRGIPLADLVSGAAFAAPGGGLLAVKLGLVALMIVYQAVFGHRRAGAVIYLNILVALIILALSVFLARGWSP